MQNLIRLIILIFFVCVYVNAKECNPQTYTYGLLYDHKVDRYQAHGLWVDSCCITPLQKNNPSYPFFCKNVTFEWNKLQPIWSNLTENWYPYGDKAQQKHLMEHEWLKHGSCTNYDILSFFSVSLCIRQKIEQVVPVFCPAKRKECTIPLEDKVHHVIQDCNLFYGC